MPVVHCLLTSPLFAIVHPSLIFHLWVQLKLTGYEEDYLFFIDNYNL
jgi:hypothetical protein